MLKQAHKDRLKALGINVDELEAAIKNDKEADITIPDGELLTAAQLTTRDGEKVKEGKKEGEKEAFNIAKKEIAKHTGLEIKAERFGDLGTEIKTAINATGDDKLKTITEQNRQLLADKEDFTKKESDYQVQLKSLGLDNQISSLLPKEIGGFKTASLLRELKADIVFEEVDGKSIAKRNGVVMSDDKTHAPLSIDAAVEAYKKERGWIETTGTSNTGGRGAGQKGAGGNITDPGSIKNKTQAEAAWKEANPDKNMLSEEGMAWYANVSKNTDFNMFE